MSENVPSGLSRRVGTGRGQALAILALLAVAAPAVVFWTNARHAAKTSDVEVSSQSKRPGGLYYPTQTQWAALAIEPVQSRVFRPELATEGKIAVNEDRSTPIFSPYAGRVTKLLAKPGDTVERGQPLFVVEATEAVHAQNDFIAAAGDLNKARAQLNLAQTVEKRQQDLYKGKAVALKDWQQSQAELVATQNDVKSAKIALEAVRNRLRILGRTDEEIAAFQEKGAISPETSIVAPIAGTIVQRKVGPGQYVTSGASDPVFIIGDLSVVWLIAYVRETEAPNVHPGQAVSFAVLAYPDQVFPANISYVAAALDSNTRRLMVRANVRNSEGLLKPEMFAIVTILTGEGDASLAVPREAIIYEDNSARVWVAHDDKSIELRKIKPGLINGRMIQVLDGLTAGEKVVSKGTLFIDRSAAGS